MKDNYLGFYESYTFYAPLKFLWDSFFEPTNIRRWSLISRQRDYLKLKDNSDLLGLHHCLNQLLLQSQNNWKSYDYGEGYFYQSLDSIGLSGLRDTSSRVKNMGLKDMLKGKTIIEIGCNSAFLSLSIAEEAKHLIGFDINPYLIDIGKITARYLGYENVELSVTSFEDFSWPEPVDVVLSFANHSTYDGNTKQSIEEYFARCSSLIKPGGLFLFESHPPTNEGEALKAVISIVEDHFNIIERKTLSYGNLLDRDRTYIIARRD